MRVLSISALFPPNVLGGAEMSASNLARWLYGQGHVVGVLTTVRSAAEESWGKPDDGIHAYKARMPRPYAMVDFPKAPGWQKPLWHLQDYLDPRNRRIYGRAIDDFKPDVAFVHVVPGLGFNGLLELADRNVPTVYFLHDLGLACAQMSMFRKGAACQQQCTVCRVSSRYKESLIAKFPRIGFCSPSRANLERLAPLFPIRARPHTSILNANRYPAPLAARSESKTLRLLYVGRLHEAKGVNLLLDAVEKVVQGGADVSVTVVGGGPEEEPLRARYGQAAWCRFTGFVTQQEVSDIMSQSDLLCVPSICFDNSPGVLIQALGLGLPALGSDIGGIPELIEEGRNGMLLPPGDSQALQSTVTALAREPGRLADWRRHALANAYKFDQDYLGNKVLEFAQEIMNCPRS
jgi:glycosyltransferase involved in cell wall biosynthesis